MITLFGNLESGNVHKVQMLLHRIGVHYRRVEVSQVRDEPRHPAFLRINPMGKVPVLLLDDGRMLSESGAILYWFAQGTSLWPDDLIARTEVLRWMFFEQYSHEPALAVLRYLRRFTAQESEHTGRSRELMRKAQQALEVLDQRLSTQPWLGTTTLTIADLALYPYTRWADEAGVDLAPYRAVEAWLGRVENSVRFLPLRCDGAMSVVTLDAYVRSAS